MNEHFARNTPENTSGGRNTADNAERVRTCRCRHAESDHEPEGECYFCDCRTCELIDGDGAHG